MVKRFLLTTAFMNLIFVLCMLFAESNEYLYSKFDFNVATFLLNLLILFVAEIIILLLFLLLWKNIYGKICFCLATACILWVLISLLSFTTIGAFWKSETDDFYEFTDVDPYLESHLSIAGLTLEDIINEDISDVKDFHYSCQSQIATIKFSFVGQFSFSDNSYIYLKNKFLSAKEFNVNIHDADLQKEQNVTGSFELDSKIPSHESSTTVESWGKCVIYFSDNENKFYFELIGNCDT